MTCFTVHSLPTASLLKLRTSMYFGHIFFFSGNGWIKSYSLFHLHQSAGIFIFFLQRRDGYFQNLSKFLFRIFLFGIKLKHNYDVSQSDRTAINTDWFSAIFASETVFVPFSFCHSVHWAPFWKESALKVKDLLGGNQFFCLFRTDSYWEQRQKHFWFWQSFPPWKYIPSICKVV